ncbi:MAG: PEGA domain-containing protein [Methanocorpusculum sp.]|nr:PEGA domain-containing protein [Methanocorpusculum sp.]
MLKHLALIILLAALLLVFPVAAANASMIENTNFITVQSSPPYADVYIDGIYQGKTPVTSPDHYEGHYEIRVVLAGYDEYIVPDLYVKPLGSGVASVTANLMKNTSIAGVVVYAEPAGVEVYVDEVYAGTVPELKDGGLQLAGYLPGNHKFRCEKDGYITVTNNYYMLSAGNTETLRVTLGKAAGTTTPTEDETIVPATTITTVPTTFAPTAPPTKAPVPILGILLGCAAAVLLMRRL